MVGISANTFGEPGNWLTAPVYNLAAPSGVLMRLGFRVADAANVVADFELNWDPPYDVVATVEDVPEPIKLFGAKLQLWGDPASVAHDSLRGECGLAEAKLPPGDIAGFEFENTTGEICPVALRAKPLLTLPTSCEGPQATFYEALSWGGDEDFGNVPTHDGAGNPTGFLGCGSLGFRLSSSAKPTTEEAQSPTGFDVSPPSSR